jgi:hypothetical protein
MVCVILLRQAIISTALAPVLFFTLFCHLNHYLQFPPLGMPQFGSEPKFKPELFRTHYAPTAKQMNTYSAGLELTPPLQAPLIIQLSTTWLTLRTMPHCVTQGAMDLDCKNFIFSAMFSPYQKHSSYQHPSRFCIPLLYGQPLTQNLLTHYCMPVHNLSLCQLVLSKNTSLLCRHGT